MTELEKKLEIKNKQRKHHKSIIKFIGFDRWKNNIAPILIDKKGYDERVVFSLIRNYIFRETSDSLANAFKYAGASSREFSKAIHNVGSIFKDCVS